MKQRLLAVPLLLAFGCGGPATPPATPAPSPPAPAAPVAVWPPRIAWPDRLALKVVKTTEHIADDGTRDVETHPYLLAFERIDATHMRFWEAGLVQTPTELYQRVVAEVGGYPSLRIGPRYNNVEHGGYPAFRDAALATRLVQSSDPDAASTRDLLQEPGTEGYVNDDNLVEWWLVVGAWDLPLQAAEHVEADTRRQVAAAVAAAGGAEATGPVRRSFEARMGGDDADWTFIAKGEEDGPTRVRLTGTWTGKLATIVFPVHFSVEADSEVDPATTHCTLTVETIADRATLVPSSIAKTWEIRYRDAAGRERTARRVERATYEEVDWSFVTWKPL